jgi:hypothetical protein
MKKEPFRPRYAHNKGYRKENPPKDGENRDYLLKSFPASEKFMNGWREYTLQQKIG